MDMDAIFAELSRDEDIRLFPYKDSVGKLTIGIGRNLDDNGISYEEAKMMFMNDVAKFGAQLDRFQPWWRNLSEERQRALLNMCFNLGYYGLAQFKTMLGALQKGDYKKAADAALDSKWALQVGARAVRIANIFLHGGTGDAPNTANT